jgi:hypothetical protein
VRFSAEIQGFKSAMGEAAAATEKLKKVSEEASAGSDTNLGRLIESAAPRTSASITAWRSSLMGSRRLTRPSRRLSVPETWRWPLRDSQDAGDPYAGEECPDRDGETEGQESGVQHKERPQGTAAFLRPIRAPRSLQLR